MTYRHELKLEITYADALMLRQRLGAVMQRDSHAVDGIYEISSLYFDNLNDKALREKRDGINIREKFRLRYYNRDTSYIRLEKKSKRNGLCLKESALLTAEQTKTLLEGDYTWMMANDEALIRELYLKMRQEGLRPKTIVDYTREAFVYAPGNVRITLDSDIRTGMCYTNFLDTDRATVPLIHHPIILEIKWDEYLPDFIRSLVRMDRERIGAFSKYAACRMYD